MNSLQKEQKKAYAKQHYAANRERYNSYTRAYRAKIRDKLQALKESIGCQLCPETDPVCLDFNHLGEKKDNISDMARAGYSWQEIVDEIAKCQLLCANCHRKYTLGSSRQRTHDFSPESPLLEI